MLMARNLTGTINRKAKGLRSLIQPPEEKRPVLLFVLPAFSWTTLAFNYLSHTLIFARINSSSPIQRDLPLCLEDSAPRRKCLFPSGVV